MAVLAVECSTRAAKAVVHSLETGVRLLVERPYPPGASTVDTLDRRMVLAAMESAMAQAARDAQAAGIQIQAIALSSIWHSMELWDRTGRPLSPLLTWASTRAADTVARAKQDPALGLWLYRRTGCVIHSMYPLWQYRALCGEDPSIARRTARVSSLAEAMMEDLTGARLLSRNTASGSGLLGLDSGMWDAQVLDMAGIHPDWLPELAEMEETRPLADDAAARTGLPAGLPVAVGGADGGLNQVGAGAGPGRMTFSVGTSGALRMACRKPLLPEAQGNWCYYLWRNTYIAGAATSGAGNCVTWLLENCLGGRYSLKDLDALLDGVDREHAPIFLPFLFGERCPGWRDDRTGGFVGLTGRHGPADLYYAVLEGILFNLYDCYAPLTQGLGEPQDVLLSGGITQSAFYRQLAADIFGRPLEYTPGEHTSAVGAAVAGHAALGRLPSPLDYQPPQGTVCRPQRKDFLAERLERYHRAYARGISSD